MKKIVIEIVRQPYDTIVTDSKDCSGGCSGCGGSCSCGSQCANPGSCGK